MMAQSPEPRAKRLRACPQQEGNYLRAKKLLPLDKALLPFRRLKHVRFPDEVLALPHVLSQINTFLLSPKDAIMEAARAGDDDWLWELVESCSCVALDAIRVAAACGHFEAVEVLYHTDYCGYEGNLKDDKWEALKRATVAAIKGNHLDIVKFLLVKLVDPDPFSNRAHEVGQLFVEAAANGQLNVVEFMTGYKELKRHLEIHAREALPRAITAGQTLVKIYDVYPQFGNDNLLVDLARFGRTSAVEYLYENGKNEPKLVGDAFVAAATVERDEVVKFLHDTGLVPFASFKTVFEDAMRWHDSKTMRYLYGLKRATQQMINQWFQVSTDVEVLKELIEKEKISAESIVAAFTKAASCANRRQVNTMKFLYKQENISPELIGTAFVSAAGRGLTDVTELLCSDPRLLPEAVDEAFVSAVSRGQAEMVKKLYSGQSITASVLLTALENATGYGYYKVARIIIEYLSADNVPHEYKLQTFLNACKRGMIDILPMMIEREDGDWPVDNLKEALSVARDEQVKNFIRALICDQIFSGRPQKVRASGDCGHLITTFQWVTEE
ncbi:hypothetical protein PF003_g39932 [Phytophthora fragariae]|uniref:Uncharacterized protein n=2 Tax=Phytophthora fragariae TaxID=53985 RepID=A0A6A3DQE4_9STRA|nr:hypothetical protein PF003_g39932 [Phytophthora fragariae]KAE8922673.1 hypothetical protein PF009_g27065 [Phytophthora fragariae]